MEIKKHKPKAPMAIKHLVEGAIGSPGRNQKKPQIKTLPISSDLENAMKNEKMCRICMTIMVQPSQLECGH